MATCPAMPCRVDIYSRPRGLFKTWGGGMLLAGGRGSAPPPPHMRWVLTPRTGVRESSQTTTTPLTRGGGWPYPPPWQKP